MERSLAIRHVFAHDGRNGRVAEWFKAPVLKFRKRCLTPPSIVTHSLILLGYLPTSALVYIALPHPSAGIWVAIPVAEWPGRPEASGMNDSRPADELGLLRWEVAQIEAGRRTLRRAGRDVTQSELGILRREIAFLEKVAARRPS